MKVAEQEIIDDKVGQSEVKAWNQTVIIPTYEIGKPELTPIFLEKRVYQGSSGSVYPHPVVEKISDTKVDKEWNAVFIENQFVKIMILPELGGRVQMAYDKVKKRHFIYRNQVIKPALVGLTGPWISGGIEFNWPQHHRPSTYDPVNSLIEEHDDGSKTIWCSELERMFRTKGTAGFRLFPDKAYLEIDVKLYNGTSEPQTFLWWANPAVAVNDHYQSVFPPDVNAVFDHGRRDVSTFPIATGTYYKVDYSAGVDISSYKNIPVPTSYMAAASKFDFLGGYENDTKGGVLHVADHHVSPGKKQWTWGNGDFGRAWDRNLTDEDGPYIELMCGVYTDNQPDFSWLMPYEEKLFKQYFMPYRDLGVVKNATKEAMINLELIDGKAVVKAYTTAEYNDAKIILRTNDKAFLIDIQDLSPRGSYERSVDVGATQLEALILEVIDGEGRILVDYYPCKVFSKPIPGPAEPAKQPQDIQSVEQLYLQGQHLEQYRHATYDASAYYLQALKIDKKDTRCNNAMGMLLLRKGRFDKALPYFQQAVETLTEKNPNPYDGEAFYNLGLCLSYLQRYDEAYDTFYKATWNAAWQDSGYFQLSRLACRKNAFGDALEFIDKSLVRNAHNYKALHLKVAILRKLGYNTKANKVSKNALEIDPFNFGIIYETHLLTKKDKDTSIIDKLKKIIEDNVHTYIEYALDYAHAGMFEEAIGLLTHGIEGYNDVYPMVHYLVGWFESQLGDEQRAMSSFKKAAAMSPNYCFPNRLEEIIALQLVIDKNPSDSFAHYYAGNFWYANRQYEKAVDCWESSRKLNDTYGILRRNLALAYFNKQNEANRAMQEMEAAFSLDNTNARLLMELDQLYRKMKISPQERLDMLNRHLACVNHRDDLYIEYVALHNVTRQHERALSLLMSRTFHPWEGGEGKVTGQYLYACLELAKEAYHEGRFEEAFKYLKQTETYPLNFGEGKLSGFQENDIHYWLGCVYRQLEEEDTAKEYWLKASQGEIEPSFSMFYNDQRPDMLFYQGLAMLKLEEETAAMDKFDRLIFHGQDQLNDELKVDYFAVSLPDLHVWQENMEERNQIHCEYLIALGHLGKGAHGMANDIFQDILSNHDPYHIGVLGHLDLDLTSLH